MSEEGHPVMKILTDAFKQGSKNFFSKLYQGIQKQKGNNTANMKVKCETELEIEISQEDWQSMRKTRQNLDGKL